MALTTADPARNNLRVNRARNLGAPKPTGGAFLFVGRGRLHLFDELIDRHTHSLKFRPLSDTPIHLPRPLVTASVDARRLWVKDELASYGNKAYWRLFPDHVPDLVDKDEEEEARELKAA